MKSSNLQNAEGFRGEFMKYKKYFSKVFPILFVFILFLVPTVIKDQFILHLFIMVFFYIILSTSLSFFYRTGQLTLGHAGFMGIGGYTSVLLTMRLNFPFVIAFSASGIMALLVALVLGKIILRSKGVYFVLITFSFTEIVRLIFVNWVSLFGGANGIPNIPSPKISLLVSNVVLNFSTKSSYYFLTLVVSIISLYLLSKIADSPVGRIFRLMKESEVLAQSTGIDIVKYSLISFSIACFFAGITGSLYAHYFRFISPYSFTFWESVNVVMICVIGGFKNLRGAVIGSIVYVALTEVVRAGKEFELIIFGFTIILIVIFSPGGLDSFFANVKERIANITNIREVFPFKKIMSAARQGKTTITND